MANTINLNSTLPATPAGNQAVTFQGDAATGNISAYVPNFPVVSVAGKTGAVTLTNTDVGADASGAAASVLLTSLQKSSNLSDLGSVTTARTNLGLVASATTDTTNAANISSGTLNNARLSAIPNTALASSSVTVTAGSGLGGGGSVALGGTTTLTANVTSVAGRTGAVTLTAADIAAGTFPGALTLGAGLNLNGQTVSGGALITFASGPQIRATANLVLSAAGTGGCYLNYDAGTGGTNFCDGAGHIVAAISSAGTATLGQTQVFQNGCGVFITNSTPSVLTGYFSWIQPNSQGLNFYAWNGSSAYVSAFNYGYNFLTATAPLTTNGGLTLGGGGLNLNGQTVSGNATFSGACTFSSVITQSVGVKASGTNNHLVLSTTDASNPFQLVFSQNAASYWKIQSVEAGIGYHPIALQSDGGNVLVGTTTDNGGLLQVNGAVNNRLTALPAYAMNSAGTNFGIIQNVNSTTWALGYGANLTTLGANTLAWNSSNRVLIGTITDNNADTLQVNGSIYANGVIKIASGNAPATSSSAGVAGSIAWDASYLYVCTATNTWKRVALTTF